jgi:hypothetical protein
LYVTHIQQDEINKMSDDKKNCINKIISIIGIKRILTSCGIIGIDEQSKRGFIGSNIGMYELVDDEADLLILEKLRTNTNSNPMGNAADLSILYTAIKKKMHYLITDDKHFGPLLQNLSKFMPNDLQVQKNYYLDSL